MTSHQSQYRSFSQKNYLPLQMQPWWLDIVCGNDAWEVALAFDKGHHIIGALPFGQSRKSGVPILQMPSMTAYAGPYINYQDAQRTHKRYSIEKEVITQLTEQLPDLPMMALHTHFEFENVQPFVWNGWAAKPRYTFLFENLKSSGFVLENANRNARRNLKSAANELIIDKNGNLNTLHKLVSQTFARQGRRNPIDWAMLEQLHGALQVRGQGNCYSAKDKAGNIIASAYLMWDERVATCLLSGFDETHRNSGALFLLFKAMIEDAAHTSDTFDFEGSMIENVAQMFISLGAVRKPYFRLYKYKNRFWEAFSVLLGKRL